MNRTLSDRPLFITGFPRSGTTLLNLILSSHSQIELKNNDDLLMEFYYKRINPNNYINEKEFDNLFLNNLNIESKRFLKMIPNELLNQVKQKLPISGWEVFQLLLSNESKKDNYWGSKTHSYIWFYDSLVNNYKNCNFIIILRDPRSVILSRYVKSISKNSNSLKDTNSIPIEKIHYDEAVSFFIQHAHHWTAWHNVFEEVKKESIKKNIYILKYEDLVSFPEQTIKQLFNHISIEYEHGIINSEQRYIHPVSNNSEIGYAHSNLKKPINKRLKNKWKKLDNRLIEIIENICRHNMLRYNYSTETNTSIYNKMYYNSYLDMKYQYKQKWINHYNIIRKNFKEICLK
tara:strand:+ start:173 stop:1210 length:1038 start_codon:yes stop_codon:yes gene_type:complete